MTYGQSAEDLTQKPEESQNPACLEGDMSVEVDRKVVEVVEDNVPDPPAALDN